MLVWLVTLSYSLHESLVEGLCHGRL